MVPCPLEPVFARMEFQLSRSHIVFCCQLDHRYIAVWASFSSLFLARAGAPFQLRKTARRNGIGCRLDISLATLRQSMPTRGYRFLALAPGESPR